MSCFPCRSAQTPAELVSSHLLESRAASGAVHSIPWDVFSDPLEVEGVSLVDRQADDFGDFKGMDGSKVETDAAAQCHGCIPQQEQAGGAGSSAVRGLCPGRSPLTSKHFVPRGNFALSLRFTTATSCAQ